MAPMNSFRRPLLLLLTLCAGLLGLALLIGVLRWAEAPHSRLRFDLSSQGQDSLSPRTVQALASLPPGSRLTAFLFPEEDRLLIQGASVYPKAFSRMRTLLQDARIEAKGQLEITILEPSTSLVSIQNARERLERQQGDLLFLETPDARRMIRFEEVFLTTEPTSKGAPARLVQERLDAALGDSALSLSADDTPLVGLLLTSEQDTITHASLAPFVQLLRDEGFEPIELRDADWPADLDILVVPGQLSAMLPSMAERVKLWVTDGMPMFLGLGYGSHAGSLEFWNQLLQPRGIALQEGLVCAPWRQVIGAPECGRLEIPPKQISSSHPVTRQMAVAGRSLLFPGSRPIQLQAAQGGFLRERIVWSSNRAWVDLDQDLEPGQLEPSGITGLCAVSEPLFPTSDSENGRIFLLGSAHAFRGHEIRFQREFLVSAFRWLRGADENYGGLRSIHDRPFRLVSDTRKQLLQKIALLPSFAILLAFFVFWRRRT
ncbi:MAG: hypothetical protein HN844_10135 [Planctomycetes bacterium]|nr:hypothetical protein [Planctomycetota bacterium]MBT7319553.1 hypothetical protein [Planctomycetota bacterium]